MLPKHQRTFAARLLTRAAFSVACRLLSAFGDVPYFMRLLGRSRAAVTAITEIDTCRALIDEDVHIRNLQRPESLVSLAPQVGRKDNLLEPRL
jgi:hypothetical protein